MQETLCSKWKEHNENNSKETIYITQIKNIVKSQKTSSQIANKFYIIMALVTSKQQN